MLLIFCLLICFLLVRSVVRRQQRREGGFRERRRRMMSIGEELDDADEFEVLQHQNSPKHEQPESIPPRPLSTDANPYRPPTEE